MKENKDINYINELILTSDILRHLQSQEINFKLYEFSNGEILINMLEKSKFIYFVMQGVIKIYGIRDDGSMYPIRYIDEFVVVGDIELCRKEKSPFLVESCGKTLCLAISLKENRRKLLQDNYFMEYIIESLSNKLALFVEYEVKFISLEEKLINYMRYECEDNMIKSVEKTTVQLKCSRRQLQRILKKLVEYGTIIKLSKGCYRLDV